MRLLSYNVLADAYVRRDWFPGTPEALLARGARTEALGERIAGFDADVVCLQEVERQVFDAIAARLTGHRGELLLKGKGKPDGCATFARGSGVSFAPLRYRDDTGHVALITSLELDGRRLAIANTHARWSPPDTPDAEHHGVRQLGELAAARRRLAPSVDGWVICGDLNAPVESAAIVQLIDAGFVDAFADHPTAYTCNANQTLKRIDFILTAAPLDVTALAPPVITSATPLPSETEPSDHLPIAAELRWAAP